VLKRHGEAGYLAEWVVHPYPTAELIVLQEWLAAQ
jgi:hypothetical protein